MEIYKLRLSYAVYQKKKWNLMKLLLKTSHFNGHSILHHQKESKNSEKKLWRAKTSSFASVSESGKGKKQAQFKLDNTNNDKKNYLLFLWNASWMLLEQTWIIWVISHDGLNFRLPCVWQNTLAFKNFCSNYLILLHGFRMHFLRAQSRAF